MRKYLIASFFLAALLSAQTDTAALTGIVSDKSVAVVPMAAVKVTNEGNNISVTVTANDKGFYVVPELRPGVYTVSTSHKGFKVNVQSGVGLQVGQTVRADFSLQIGDTTETVVVAASASVLDTETSDRGSVINGREIAELPLNGRDFMHLRSYLQAYYSRRGA